MCAWVCLWLVIMCSVCCQLQWRKFPYLNFITSYNLISQSSESVGSNHVSISNEIIYAPDNAFSFALSLYSRFMNIQSISVVVINSLHAYIFETCKWMLHLQLKILEIALASKCIYIFGMKPEHLNVSNIRLLNFRSSRRFKLQINALKTYAVLQW